MWIRNQAMTSIVIVMAVGRCTSILVPSPYFYFPAFPAHISTYKNDEKGIGKHNQKE